MSWVNALRRSTRSIAQVQHPAVDVRDEVSAPEVGDVEVQLGLAHARP